MKLSDYQMRYDPNGGSGSVYTEPWSRNSYWYFLAKLSETGFTAPSDKPYFKGWSTSTDGESILPERACYSTKGDATFYAIWWKGVESVHIDRSLDWLRRGVTTALGFSASVSGVADISQAVTWSLIGASSSGTTVSPTGVITVAADETATSITVRATSVVDPDKYAEKSVGIITYTDVAVTPQTASIPIGGSGEFRAVVSGNGPIDHTIIWSITGNTSETTQIFDTGRLTLGPDKPAGTLTITATAKGDHSKTDQATVTVFHTGI